MIWLFCNFLHHSLLSTSVFLHPHHLFPHPLHAAAYSFPKNTQNDSIVSKFLNLSKYLNPILSPARWTRHDDLLHRRHRVVEAKWGWGYLPRPVAATRYLPMALTRGWTRLPALHAGWASHCALSPVSRQCSVSVYSLPSHPILGEHG